MLAPSPVRAISLQVHPRSRLEVCDPFRLNHFVYIEILYAGPLAIEEDDGLTGQHKVHHLLDIYEDGGLSNATQHLPTGDCD